MKSELIWKSWQVLTCQHSSLRTASPNQQIQQIYAGGASIIYSIKQWVTFGSKNSSFNDWMTELQSDASGKPDERMSSPSGGFLLRCRCRRSAPAGTNTSFCKTCPFCYKKAASFLKTGRVSEAVPNSKSTAVLLLLLLLSLLLCWLDGGDLFLLILVLLIIVILIVVKIIPGHVWGVAPISCTKTDVQSPCEPESWHRDWFTKHAGAHTCIRQVLVFLKWVTIPFHYTDSSSLSYSNFMHQNNEVKS